MKKIPDHLKSAHLFLLVGENPLPNWVAARLLAKPDGKIYLIHSGWPPKSAETLAKFLFDSGCQQPVYIPVDPKNAADIYQKVYAYAEKAVLSREIGFNYTGGNKRMAVHAYRAMQDAWRALPGNRPLAPVYSYLDAHDLHMHFDEGEAPCFVGLAAEASLSLAQIIKLNGGIEKFKEPNRTVKALEVAQALAELHKDEAGYNAWRDFITQLQRDPNRNERSLAWPKPVDVVGKALAANNPVDISLHALCRQRVWPFADPGQLADWLEGKWLESYLLHTLGENREKFNLSDFGGSFKIKDTRFDFEADGVAVRNYQLYFFSCYAGHKKPEVKRKLFEAYVRARQIGGEEASAAVLCMSDEEESVEQDIISAWPAAAQRIRVFGRKTLANLENELNQWFSLGIPDETGG